MVGLINEYFSLAQIAASGQCFRMDRLKDGSYSVAAADKYIRIFQDGSRICFDCTEAEFEACWRHYFDLDTDYGKYISAVDEKDEYLCAAVNFGSGIRILNQDLWEMIVSFIISQQNNITRIKKCIFNICKAYGEIKKAPDGTEYYSFQTPGALAHLVEDALMICNLGYRSKYVVRTAREIDSGKFSLEALRECSYEEARLRLLELYGVGKKVADCICLFALHKIEAFPIDTHIRQVLEKYYADGFPFKRYEGFAGVIQQYIFFYDLK